MRIVLIAVALSVVACGGEAMNPPGTNVQTLCGTESRGDTYVAGLEKTGDAGMLKVRLVESTPAPPDRGLNQWTFEVVEMDGTPVPDATLRVKPWMPDHGHGTNPLWQLPQPMNEAGKYQLRDMDLFMSGFWNFQVEVDQNGTEDKVSFGFCIEG